MGGWLRWAILIFAFSLVVTACLGFYYNDLSDYFQGIAIESAGVTLEILLLVLILGAYEKWRSKSEEIERLKQRIDDVKKINDPHAHGIIASAIRRLSKFKITNVDLRGVSLSNFSFSQNDIHSLANAVFSDGLRFDYPSKNFTTLKDVDFTDLDCEEVQFGSGNLSFVTFDDCTFWGTNLRNARFDGAKLHWSQDKVLGNESDWYETIDYEDDGSPITARIYTPAFEGADLSNTSFKGVNLKFADFRHAKNVLQANFDSVKGLDTCFFDRGVKEQLCIK